MQRTFLATLIAVFGILASCGDKASTEGKPHGTIMMRDGSRIVGSIVETSGQEMKITGDDGSSHTVRVDQIKSIDYDEAPATAAAPPADKNSKQPVAPPQ